MSKDLFHCSFVPNIMYFIPKQLNPQAKKYKEKKKKKKEKEKKRKCSKVSMTCLYK